MMNKSNIRCRWCGNYYDILPEETIENTTCPACMCYNCDNPINFCECESYYNHVIREVGKGEIHVLRKDSARLFVISNFFVEEKYRKQGIGTKLLKEAIKYYKDETLTDYQDYPLILYVLSANNEFTNEELVSFYTKHGFTSYEDEVNCMLMINS